MAVNPENIKAQVKLLIKTNQKLPPAEAEEAFAEQLTSIIVQAILSATVNVIIPTGVVTQGSSPAAVPNLLPIPLSGSLT